MKSGIRNFAAARALLFMMAVAPVMCWAAKEFVMPKPQAAKLYPAHDEHSNEQVGVGAEPYDTREKAEIFSVHYSEMGILPVFVVVTNDGDQPVALTGMHAEMVTGDRAKLTPMSADDIYRRLSHPHPHTSNYPLPVPLKKMSGGVNQRTRDEIQNARFDARAVEPRGTQAGFFFFDVADLPDAKSGSHLYLTGVRDAKGDELMFFDVDLGNN